MRIQKFSEYNFQEQIAYDFINSFDNMILESDESDYKKIEKKIVDNLKLHMEVIALYGAGIGALYPVVEKLMKNMSIRSIELTPDRIVLLVISALTITYLEEKKFRSSEEEAILTKDSKSMLEELKMMGIGNGIVKKLIKVLKSIKMVFNIIGKHLNKTVVDMVDMFAYTALFIPIMNGILALIGKYNLNLDTIIENFTGLAIGVGTIIARHGISHIIDKIKERFPINKKKILDDIKVEPAIQKFNAFKASDETELIKEQ